MTALPLALAPIATDQAELLRRRSTARLRPDKPQMPMDIGLFNTDGPQLDLLPRKVAP